MDKAFSINEEDWNYTDAAEALQALADEDRLVEGAIYYESDCEEAQPAKYINADQVLDHASERIYEEIGEAAEDAFTANPEAVQELDELLKAWTRKHITGRYWLCTGKPREIKVTAADVAEYSAR